MYTYLTTFRTRNGGFNTLIYTMADIARLVGGATSIGDTAIRVWRVLPNAQPEPMRIYHALDTRSVWLTDCYGNLIETARYPA